MIKTRNINQQVNHTHNFLRNADSEPFFSPITLLFLTQSKLHCFNIFILYKYGKKLNLKHLLSFYLNSNLSQINLCAWKGACVFYWAHTLISYGEESEDVTGE